MDKKTKESQINIRLHQGCIERIEEMYRENKDFYKLYQEYYTKYNFANSSINKLKKEVEDKDEEIKVLKDKNDILIKLLNKYNIKGLDELNNDKQASHSKEGHLDIIDKNIIKDHNGQIVPNIENINNFNNIDEEKIETNKDNNANINLYPKNEIKHNEIYNDNISLSSDDSNNINDEEDKNIIDQELPFKKCPIISINTKTDLHTIDWKQHVSTEVYSIIKNNYNLYEKICKDKNVNKETLDEAIIYILNKRDIEDIPQNRAYIRDTLIRSFFLYDTYKDNLKYISFSFSKMTRIPKKKWDRFLEYLNNKINQISKLADFENNNITEDKLEDINISEIVNINVKNNEGPSTSKKIDKENINIQNNIIVDEDPVIVEKIKNDVNKLKIVLDKPCDIIKNTNLCLSCNKYPRTINSFCNKCATPA